MTYRTGYKMRNNKNKYFPICLFTPASVHETRHARASATLPTSFRISSVGDIFVNKL